MIIAIKINYYRVVIRTISNESFVLKKRRDLILDLSGLDNFDKN